MDPAPEASSSANTTSGPPLAPILPRGPVEPRVYMPPLNNPLDGPHRTTVFSNQSSHSGNMPAPNPYPFLNANSVLSSHSGSMPVLNSSLSQHPTAATSLNVNITAASSSRDQTTAFWSQSQPSRAQPSRAQARGSQARRSQPRRSQPRRSNPRGSDARRSNPRRSNPRRSNPRPSQPRQSQPAAPTEASTQPDPLQLAPATSAALDQFEGPSQTEDR